MNSQNAAQPEAQLVAPRLEPTTVQTRPTPSSSPSHSMTDAEIAAKKADMSARIAAFKKTKAAQQAGNNLQPPAPANNHGSLPPTSNLQQTVAQHAENDQKSPLLTREQDSLPSTSEMPQPAARHSGNISGSSLLTQVQDALPPQASLQQASGSVPIASSTPQSGHIISRAPVRYNVAAITTGLDDHAASVEQPENPLKTKNPVQKSFAERMLEKQGWQKGQGLGAKGQGIITPVFQRPDKRKRFSDAEGGGWAAPANMGRLVGGKKAKTDDSDDNEPQPSVVVKYTGLLAGLDASEEISENNLYQRIGETMTDQFGTVERIYVWVAGDNEVFIKFTDGMGALRATTKDFVFKGNTVIGRYYPEDKFEDGDYSWEP
nr:splicing factor u2af large subunit a [Quercus suber]